MYARFFKRIIDIFCAIMLFVFLSPLLLVLLVFAGVYKHRRVGKHQKIFWFYKFKSMTDKRDENGNPLPDSERITKFGKFIRKTSLDELPQLWNILKGDMSFIGPRPKDVKECVFFDEQQCGRFRVRPGLSGLAQVSGRNAMTFDKVAEFDNIYADKITFFGDVKIALKTILVVFRPKSIDSSVQGTDHLSFYYNDYLLQQGVITKEQYDQLVNASKSLTAGTIMREGLEKIRVESEEVV